MTKVIVVEQERCLACGSCMLECAMAHTDARTLAEALQAETPPQPRVYVEPIGQFGMPLQCRHCEEAPCIAVCPTHAIDQLRSGGPVLLNQDRCIGCRFCVLVCPFGVIELARSGKVMIKCDLCIARTEVGEDPACVSACPTRAMQFRELDEWLRERRREAAKQFASGEARARQVVMEMSDGR